MIVIDNEFELKQVVYLKTDPDQLPRMVTSIEVFPPPDNPLYKLIQGTSTSWHYAFEISAEKDVCFDAKTVTS